MVVYCDQKLRDDEIQLPNDDGWWLVAGCFCGGEISGEEVRQRENKNTWQVNWIMIIIITILGEAPKYPNEPAEVIDFSTELISSVSYKLDSSLAIFRGQRFPQLICIEL